jgi:PAT family beta-lactamase induction signal transducer AmpG
MELPNSRAVHFKWFASLYFFQAMPFFLVTSVSTVLYKQYGISNSVLALAGSVFYLPWVLKPLGGPFVQAKGTLKKWTYFTQLIVGALTLFAALATHSSHFILAVSALFLLIAGVATLHDIGAEGIYIAALSPVDQSWFVGLRSTFFRLGWLTMQGLFVAWIGKMGEQGMALPEVWRTGFNALAAAFIIFGLYHWWSLPDARSKSAALSNSAEKLEEEKATYLMVLLDFFKRPHLKEILAYLLVFRLGEAQLQKLAMPFLLDPRTSGGLGLSTKHVGLLYGSLGPLALTCGGLLGGWIVTKQGLKKWFVPMTIALNIPHVVYLLLALFPTSDLLWIGTAINIEQFFYGFAFTAYMIFLIEVSRTGRYPTAGYALGTGLMAFGMMIPGAWSGKLQEVLGYPQFFTWVLLCSLPSIWVTVRAARILEGMKTPVQS